MEHLEPINVIVDGISAYDFRESINSLINQNNKAFDQMNNMNESIKENAQIAQDSANQATQVADDAKNYMDNIAKPELEKYFNQFLSDHVEDIPTIQVRRNKPILDENNYAPDFWYKIIKPADAGLILYSELISVSNKIVFNSISKEEIDSGEVKELNFIATWITSGTPDSKDLFGIKLELEGGCTVTINEADKTKLPKVYYDKNEHFLYWDCGTIASGHITDWDRCKNLRVGITVDDGVIQQRYLIKINIA